MHLFRPVDSEAKRLAEREAARKTPKSCSNRRGTNRVEGPKRTAGESYSVDSYRRAIARACQRAGVEQWSPHQLRHSAATEIRKVFGLEAAQIILGHSQADVTQVYAERDFTRGVEVAKRIG
jgi:integrase